MDTKGIVYLIPTTLGGEDWNEVIPQYVAEIIRSLNHFIVEDLRTARRYLSRIGMSVPIDQLQIEELNEHTSQNTIEELFLPIRNGGARVGLLSEAGVPAVADPGAALVSLAHRYGTRVVPLVGPSSIIMGLMASGLNGQNFAFVGYLPIKPKERADRIAQLEHRSRVEKQTQLFIEAPYRNNQLLSTLVQVLKPQTLLHVSCDLTLSTEFISTKTVSEWKKKMPDFHKRPSIFGIYVP